MILRAFLTVGALTGMSRVLGFLRDISIASFFGTSVFADAFVMAFRLPNLFRRLFAEGAYTAAFVPIYASTLAEKGQEEATLFANRSSAVLTIFLSFLSILAILFMPWIIKVIAPGFVEDQSKFDLTVSLSRIMFVYLLFMALTAHLSGILNSHKKFAVAAAAPVILNLVFLIALLVVIPLFYSSVYVLAFAVSVAGLAQFLLVFFAVCRIPVKLAVVKPTIDGSVKKLFKLMGPGLVTGGAQQLNLIVGSAIASMQAGAASYLYYADRVYQLPLGLVGVALGVVLLPQLSSLFRSKDQEKANNLMNSGLELALLFTLPATAALLVIAEPVVIGLFERGAFDRASSSATAAALMAYAIGLPSFVLAKVMAPGFFAQQNTKTPMYYALWTIGLNLILALAFGFYWGFVGIALATSLAGWLNVFLLAGGLYKRGLWRWSQHLLLQACKLVLCSSVMASLLHWLAPIFGRWLGESPFDKILHLTVLVGIGIVSFFFLTIVTKTTSLARLRTQLAKKG